MIKVGQKGKAAIMMVTASAPANVGGRYFRRDNLIVFPLSRTRSTCSQVVSEKKNREGGDDAEGRTLGDIQVYSRVTGESLEFDVQDKKSWWMPHPVTGVFSPYGQEALHVTMKEDEKS